MNAISNFQLCLVIVILYFSIIQSNTYSTMRLDPSYLNYITRQQLRVLVAIEMGMKNHEFVPARLIHGIANLKTGDTYKIIRQLLKLKFICHVSKKYDGYKLNYLGYDYLALQTFMKRGTIRSVVCKIGVGKQSDIYKCIDQQGIEVVLKFARLGRTSFRTIKNNRDYIKNRTGYNWLYLSRLSTIREYSFMEVLFKNGFPTPTPIDCNRHGIVMSLIDGCPLHHVRQLGDCETTFKSSLELINRFAQYGLIHGDFNEFNLMINQENQLTVIDFPQCVSTNHLNAKQYFNRDVECIYTFFEKLREKSLVGNEKNQQFSLEKYMIPDFRDVKIIKHLDIDVRASGYYDKRNFTEVDLKNYQEYQEFNRRLRRGVDYVAEEEFDSQEEDYFFNQAIDKGDYKEQEEENQLKDLVERIEDNYKDLQPLAETEPIQDKEPFHLEDSDSEEGNEQDERFKGMTDYQIRQILKEQKLKTRAKKKEQLKNQGELIKEIARRKKRQHKRITLNKNKGINKVHPDDIIV